MSMFVLVHGGWHGSGYRQLDWPQLHSFSCKLLSPPKMQNNRDD